MSFLRDFVRGAARRVEEPSDEQVVTEEELAEIRDEFTAKLGELKQIADNLDRIVDLCDRIKVIVSKPDATLH